jgi:FlaA1/EpsC-like NDP-sugar epimerase
VDFPLRRQLRKIVDRVSMPLLLLDLGAIALSIYLSFSLRFDTTKEFSANLPVAYAMFWSALLIRIGVSIAFKSVSPDVLGLPFKQMLYRILFAVTAGSAVVGLLMFAFFSLGWLENLPRSILLLDWGMMLLFSTLIRLAVKKRDLYQVTPAAVKAN